MGVLFCCAFYQPCAINGDVYDSRLIQPEHLFALYRRGGIVKVNDGFAGALQGVKGALDQLRAGLGQDLDGDVIGHHAFLNDRSYEVKVRLRGGGEAHFDFLETHLHQQGEQTLFFGHRHGLDQSLVAVPQIHAAPGRRLRDDLIRPGTVG